MFKKIFVFSLMPFMLFIIFYSGSQACARNHNLIGDWDLMMQGVFYTPDTGPVFTEVSGSLHITQQEGCLFYGETEIYGVPGCDVVQAPITGVINRNRISFSFTGAMMRGILLGSKIKLTLEDVDIATIGGPDMQSAGIGTAIKSK